MYKAIQSGNKGVIVSIITVVLFFAIACADHAHGAGYKSEDELIDEVRARVEKHLNDKWQASSPTIKDESVPTAPKTSEEPRIIIEEKMGQSPSASAKASADKSGTVPIFSPAEQNSPVVQEQPVPEKSEEDPPEIITMDPESNSVTPSDEAAIGIDVESVKGIEKVMEVKPLVEPVLKKMDISKIGASPYYETYEGLRLLKYFTVAQRVEIYQEARPIDSYILDAFAMRYANWPHTPWNIKSDYRTQLVPVFTRAYGTEITMSNPKNKEGQIRYTHDYREIYKNYYPKWPQIKKEMWDQNEVLIMHSKVIEPIGWNYTSNVGYRYSTLSDKEDPSSGFNSYYNIRQTYFGSLSLAPNPKFEWFGQAEYYKSKYVKCSWAYSPDHFLGRTELRIKSDDMKTMYVPSFSYSKDYYYPFLNTYEKYEIQFRVGRDFTKRFSASSTVKYAMGLRNEADHVDWLPGPVSKPFKDKAYAISLENRFSYNVYDRLYLQAGADISNGLNWSIFDNVAMLAGLEYYAPGMIRVDVGWTGNYYYNLQDFMSSIYFKCYFFM